VHGTVRIVKDVLEELEEKLREWEALMEKNPSGNPEQIEGDDNILLSCKTKYIILFANCC